MEVSGDCRREGSEYRRVRGGRFLSGDASQASLTVLEAKSLGRDGTSALRWRSLESKFKCRWEGARLRDRQRKRFKCQKSRDKK